MLTLSILMFYSGVLCYFHYQYKKGIKDCKVTWNGSKYIVRDKKGRIKLQAKGRINGLFDIIKLGEMK